MSANGKAATTTPADRGGQLLALLAEADATDLAAVDQELAAARATVASLEQVRRLIDVRLNGKPERAKPTRKAKPAGEAGPADGKGDLRDARRKAIARLLAAKGPTLAMQIAEHCNIPSGTISSVLQCEWFEPTTAGYRLTVIGRKEAGV